MSRPCWSSSNNRYNEYKLVKVSLAQHRLTVNNRSWEEEEERKEIRVNIEDRLMFSLRLVRAEYSMWNKTENHLQNITETPWLDLLDFPLISNRSEENILQSSGLITGKTLLPSK